MERVSRVFFVTRTGFSVRPHSGVSGLVVVRGGLAAASRAVIRGAVKLDTISGKRWGYTAMLRVFPPSRKEKDVHCTTDSPPCSGWDKDARWTRSPNSSASAHAQSATGCNFTNAIVGKVRQVLLGQALLFDPAATPGKRAPIGSAAISLIQSATRTALVGPKRGPKRCQEPF